MNTLKKLSPEVDTTPSSREKVDEKVDDKTIQDCIDLAVEGIGNAVRSHEFSPGAQQIEPIIENIIKSAFKDVVLTSINKELIGIEDAARRTITKRDRQELRRYYFLTNTNTQT